MNIHYTQNGSLVAITTNANAVPRVGDKIKMQGFIFRVKEIIWHIENNTWVEVLV